MSFMQEEISIKQDGWQIETQDNGTCFLPCDVQSVPDWLARGVTVDQNDALIFDALVSLISDYIPAHHIQSIEAIKPRYFARMSAPGYLDCADWCAFNTIKEAREHLRDMYGHGGDQ